MIRPLATTIAPYTKVLHKGKLPQLNLRPPLVPNPSSVARVRAVGSGAIQLKLGDLVYVDSTVHARDNPQAVIMQGRGGGDTELDIRLMQQGSWRDGSLQQYQRVPLEN